MIYPATSAQQYRKEPLPGTMGFLYMMSPTDLDGLVMEQCLKGRQHLYLPIQIQSKSLNGSKFVRAVVTSVFVDMIHTRDGSIDLTDLATMLHWSTGIKRMEVMRMQPSYVQMIKAKLKGGGTDIEPMFVRRDNNTAIEPQAAQRQASTSSASRSAQHQQQPEQQKHKNQHKQPPIKISQKQRDGMLQQILRHARISKEQVSKLTEKYKTAIVQNYLRKRQRTVLAREKAALALKGTSKGNTAQGQISQGRQIQAQGQRSNPNIGLLGQHNNQYTVQRKVQNPEEQLDPHQETYLNNIIRRQKDAARRSSEQNSRHDSSMPPPPTPARRSSQSSQNQGQSRSQSQNGGRPSAQLNYPQNPNNLKRPASNSISSANAAPDAKRQDIGKSTEVRDFASTPNTNASANIAHDHQRDFGDLKRPASNQNANANLSNAPEPKRKKRGRPRRETVVVPPTEDSQDVNQNQVQRQVVGNGGDRGKGGKGRGGKASGGKARGGNVITNAKNVNANVNSNASMIGNALPGNHMLPESQVQNGNTMGNGYGNGNGNGSMNIRGNTSMLDRTQVLPHVEQAAKMVHYFQPKVGVEKAGDGHLQ